MKTRPPMRRRSLKTDDSDRVARELRETIASMDSAQSRKLDIEYRAASAQAFRLACALSGARTFREVVTRLTRV